MADQTNTPNPSARQALLDLALRCELEPPSWALTCDIEAAFNPGSKVLRSTAPGESLYLRQEKGKGHREWRQQSYVTSVDAAKSLEPPDAQEVCVRCYPNGRMYVRITTAGGKVAYCEGLDRPIGEARARCAAALRARASLEQEGEAT